MEFTPEQQEIFDKEIAKITAKWKTKNEKLEVQLEDLKKANETETKPTEIKNDNSELSEMKAQMSNLMKLFEAEKTEREKLAKKNQFQDAVKAVEKEFGKTLPSFILRNILQDGNYDEVVESIKQTYKEFEDETKAHGYFKKDDVQQRKIDINNHVNSDDNDYKSKIDEARKRGDIVAAIRLELEAKEKNIL